eukprot:scaffold7819_cov323-Prasinococcus_capsulatus_cf.AAC.2
MHLSSSHAHVDGSGPDEELLRLDHHRSFVVSYQDGADVDLAYHYDDSEVTLNLSLGTEFEDGGELLFGGLAENFAGDAAANSAHLSRRAVVHQVRPHVDARAWWIWRRCPQAGCCYCCLHGSARCCRAASGTAHARGCTDRRRRAAQLDNVDALQ